MHLMVIGLPSVRINWMQATRQIFLLYLMWNTIHNFFFSFAFDRWLEVLESTVLRNTSWNKTHEILCFLLSKFHALIDLQDFVEATVRLKEKWKSVHRWKSTTKREYSDARESKRHCVERQSLKYLTKFHEILEGENIEVVHVETGRNAIFDSKLG